jgi:hypothetical protein
MQCLDLAPARTGIAWLSRVQRLAEINRSLPSWCAEPWVRQIRVANVRDQTVVVFSASAAALIPLRHRSGAFLLWLNDRYRLSCTRLDAKVRPPAGDRSRVYRPVAP